MTLILSGTDGVSDVDGSAATPAVRGADTNTGIFFPAADTIGFSEGGVEVARITNTAAWSFGSSGTATGTAGQVLTSAGSGAAPAWATPSAGALAFITSVTASNSATVDIENAMTAYDVYVIEGVNIVNSTNNSNLRLQLKIGGSYITTSTYLAATANNFATGGAVSVDNSASPSTFIKLLPNVSSTASRTVNISIKIYTPANTTVQKQVSFNYAFLDSASYTDSVANGFGGGTNSGTGAVTGVRILSSSGNITSGTFRLYGIANS